MQLVALHFWSQLAWTVDQLRSYNQVENQLAAILVHVTTIGLQTVQVGSNLEMANQQDQKNQGSDSNTQVELESEFP